MESSFPFPPTDNQNKVTAVKGVGQENWLVITLLSHEPIPTIQDCIAEDQTRSDN